MKEISETIPKDEFVVNFSTKHMIDGLSPFRKKWSIIILMQFKNGEVTTFQKLQQKFRMSPSVLASTLRELTFERILSRKVYGQTPPLRIEYSITSHGERMISALVNLMELIQESKKLD